MFFVEIDGTTYGMKYGHSSLKKFMHQYNLKRLVELEQLPGKLTVEDMPAFVKAGFDTAAKVQGETEPFTPDEVADLLENNLWLETAAIEAFAASISRPATRKDEEGDEPQPEPAGNLTSGTD